MRHPVSTSSAFTASHVGASDAETVAVGAQGVAEHVGEACIIVRDLDDADSVGGPAPVQTHVKWHVLSFLGCSRLTLVGRSCGSLTDRRSGDKHWRFTLRSVALYRHLAVQLVSCGPSSGKQTWPSRQTLGLSETIPTSQTAPDNTKVHQ
jgi:hypothetical protein